MIKVYKKIIDETLLQYFNEILEDENYSKAKKTIESMKYTTCLAGKRLRAILCLESCNLCSNDYFAAVPSACALEMLHAQSLIHDDLPSMDNDDLRRQKPSNHKVFGEAAAILAGDALISLGGEIIIKKTPETISRKRIIETIYEYLRAAGIFGIVGGQTADIEAQELEEDEKSLEFIQKYKTGALFEASVVMGAIIGGSEGEKIQILRNFARSFGRAFQMADDILDVTSTSEILGKTAGKDKKENKLTYVKIYGLEGAREKLNSQIKQTCDILNEGGIDSDVFNKIIQSVTC
ncbi:MAG: polyprenyl synthetase family protein [Candidatus Gastranaerophilales bacterium]|nr:polyprenyl synthetase family protein [Candidatus Gastranaerophilales bacterium]